MEIVIDNRYEEFEKSGSGTKYQLGALIVGLVATYLSLLPSLLLACTHIPVVYVS